MFENNYKSDILINIFLKKNCHIYVYINPLITLSFCNMVTVIVSECSVELQRLENTHSQLDMILKLGDSDI